MNVTSAQPAPTLQVHTVACATMAIMEMAKIAQVDKKHCLVTVMFYLKERIGTVPPQKLKTCFEILAGFISQCIIGVHYYYYYY